MIDVVALGELLIDFAAKSTDSAGYPTMAANPGGAPGNFLAALNAYGRKTAFLGKVGNDAFGNLLLGTLNAAGIETKGILVDDSVFTTLAFVTFDESGDRSFSFARKPGADTQLRWEEVDKSLIDEAKVFHFGTLSLTDEPVRTATQKAVAYAKAQGKLISCDPNLRLPLWPDADAAKEQMLWSLRQADVVKISDNEVEFLWNCTPEEGADKLLTEFGVSLAMVTLGPDGCLLKTRTAAFRAVCPKVHPVDTTGAGDIFGGSAMARLLELDKPVIIHDREAHGACLDAVCRHEGVRGVFHGFSGSAEMAKELVRREFFIAFGGALTYRGADRLRAVAASVPPDRLLLETDCPYMPPVPLRGTVNRSDNILHIARVLAPLHGMTPEELADITNRNAVRLFGLDAILPNLC